MLNRRVVAIHQPNFFPWLGYFNKLARADVFVVLDNVQFPKTGGTWMNRVRMSIGSSVDWASMPVVRSYHGLRLVCEMKINDETPWRKKLLRTLDQSYRQAPYFKEIYPLLKDLIENPTDHLLDFNLYSFSSIASAMGLKKAEIVLGSSLDVKGQATDLLIDIVKAVGGTTYLCGGGAGEYQEDEKFSTSGVQLEYQRFEHPTYPQKNFAKFYPGLSIIDALANCGLGKTYDLLCPSEGVAHPRPSFPSQ
jgi:hypothetical protein